MMKTFVAAIAAITLLASAPSYAKSKRGHAKRHPASMQQKHKNHKQKKKQRANKGEKRRKNASVSVHDLS